jgi:nicotinamidase-related amidase
MKYDALLVVDIQIALMNEHPYNETTFIENTKQLIALFRKNNIPVIYVQHDGGAGDELERGLEGWKIYSEIAPLEGEVVVDKCYNSSFRQTTLKSELSKLQAQNIVLCGMQTEHCIDATCKAAFEHGYNVTIIKGTTTTFDNDFASGEKLSQYYEEKIWNNRYAKVIPMQEIVSQLNS